MGSHSPLMFESDEELVSDENVKLEEIETKNDQTLQCSPSASLERRLVERVRVVLTGVPPPPSVTVSQHSASEILQLINENKQMLDLFNVKKDLTKTLEKEEAAKTSSWPDVSKCHHYGVMYNHGQDSEELSLLTAKYQERYIVSETSTACNALFHKSPILTASAKKRARRHAWGHSPGRRLSHLARRRHTFSSDNLQKNIGKSLPNKNKMILVDGRKSENRRKGKNSATKSTGNLKNRLAPKPSVNSSKRALFQSPENETNSQAAKKPRTPLTEPSTLKRLKRALWPDDPPVLKPQVCRDKENGSSNQTNETRSSPEKKCLRSLSFKNGSCTDVSSDTKMPQLHPEVLSKLHKQKLLWAVADALRKHGIGMNHKYFQHFVPELYKICKHIWLSRFAHQEKSGSTSDKMLELTKQFANDVIKNVTAKLEMKTTGIESSSFNNSVAGGSNSRCFPLDRVLPSNFSSTGALKSKNCNTEVDRNSESKSKFNPDCILNETQDLICQLTKSYSSENTDVNVLKTDDSQSNFNLQRYVKKNIFVKETVSFEDHCQSKNSSTVKSLNLSPKLKANRKLLYDKKDENHVRKTLEKMALEKTTEHSKCSSESLNDLTSFDLFGKTDEIVNFGKQKESSKDNITCDGNDVSSLNKNDQATVLFETDESDCSPSPCNLDINGIIDTIDNTRNNTEQ